MSFGSISICAITLPLVIVNPSNVHFVSVPFPLCHIVNHVRSRCRGLRVLVDLLDEDYQQQASLVENALIGVGSVFELQVLYFKAYLCSWLTLLVGQSPTPKNDFCRMFIREGLLDVGKSCLPPLAAVLNTFTTAFNYSLAKRGSS